MRPAVRVAAYLVPLSVLPSSLWRIGELVDFNPACANGSWFEPYYIVSLSVVSFGAACLTLGLVRPWGEIWPAWVPRLGGRVVPLRFAMTAAGTGLAIIFGVYGFWVLKTVFDLREPVRHPGCPPPEETSGAWIAYASYAPLLLWGPLLLLVTVAYYRRRRRASFDSERRRTRP